MSRKVKNEPEAAREPLNTYGIDPVPGFGQDYYDRVAFMNRWRIDRGVPPRPELFRRIADALLPDYFEWHEWTLRLVETCCQSQEMDGKARTLACFPGSSNSAKTRNISGFAAAWWLCAPAISSVMLVSTSKGSLRKRAWRNIQICYNSPPLNHVGFMTDSEMIWRAQKGDHMHAVFGKAVEDGSVAKVADDIQGVHTIRQMVVIDEATSVPDAIYEATKNLYSMPYEFVLVLLGNPRSRLDSFGRMLEPAQGWTSISVDDEEWVGKPQPEFGGMIPYICRFDAEKSPNIVSGRLVSQWLPTKETVEARRAGGQSPSWWTYFRGFPPPDGLTKTVFSASAIAQHNGSGKFTFSGEGFFIVGAFDPAFGGGDRPVLRFAKVGFLEDGRQGIEWLPPQVIPINMDRKSDIAYQLVEEVSRRCDKINIGGMDYSCPPENLGIDAGGAGGPLCDMFERMWSPKILRIVFGGAASTDAVSPEDPRPANEVYWTKSVEMHFRAREALLHDQLRGIDADTARELCTREFDDLGKRIRLQDKQDYRKQYKESPDYGDSGVCTLEVARIRGFRLSPIGFTRTRSNDWDKMVSEHQAVYESAYADQQPEEAEYAFSNDE